MTKREELAERATDYVLEHGLIGLSLRPLAAELGTSDRMLIYHFGSKDELIAAVLATSNERSMRTIRTMSRSSTVRAAIVDLWDAFTSTDLEVCQRMYVEAAALGLFGREPYAASVRESNEVWLEAITDHLRSAGASQERAPRLAALVDAAINGLLFDRPLDDDAAARQVVEDLADALG
jgi:AcrR family transcriptional regulator